MHSLIFDVYVNYERATNIFIHCIAFFVKYFFFKLQVQT